MPIEVRELIIKAVVQQDRSSGAAGMSANSGGDNDIRPDEEMLNKCLDKITEIMKERHER